MTKLLFIILTCSFLFANATPAFAEGAGALPADTQPATLITAPKAAETKPVIASTQPVKITIAESKESSKDEAVAIADYRVMQKHVKHLEKTHPGIGKMAKKVLEKKLSDFINQFWTWWYVLFVFILGAIIEIPKHVGSDTFDSAKPAFKDKYKALVSRWGFPMVLVVGIGLSFIPGFMTGQANVPLKPIGAHLVIASALSAFVAFGYDTKIFQWLLGLIKSKVGSLQNGGSK